MLSLYDFQSMSKEEKHEWEIVHSSLNRSTSVTHVTYEQCRAYACKSIASSLTNVSIKNGEVVEIPYGVPFHFIGRVDTSSDKNNPQSYYEAYKNRNFISYTTICNKNVSHYKGEVFFVYNIYPEDIVHIFPMDSDTKKSASKEEELTCLPSLWLTLSQLDMLSTKLGVYNQITAKTKRNGQIIKPFAVVAFDQTNCIVQKAADLFEIGTVIIHPDENAVQYSGDLLYDWYKLQSISQIMKEIYGFSVSSMYYAD